MEKQSGNERVKDFFSIVDWEKIEAFKVDEMLQTLTNDAALSTQTKITMWNIAVREKFDVVMFVYFYHVMIKF